MDVTKKMRLVGVFVAVLIGAIAVWPIMRASRGGVPALGTGGALGGLRQPQLRYTFGEGQAAGLGNPLAVTGSGGEVYVSDAQKEHVLVFNRDGSFVRRIGERGESPEQLRYPYGVALHERKLYVADMGAATILVFDPGGKLLGTFGSPGLLSKPTDLEFHGDKLYVADAGLHQVLVLDAYGNLLERIGGPGEGEGRFRYPNGIALADDGTLYVADSGNDRVQVFDAADRFLRVIKGGEKTGPLSAPRGIALDRYGTLYVVAGLQNTVVAFDRTGRERFRLTAPKGSPEALYLPNGLYVDPEGRIYVTESGNRRVSVFE